MSADERKLASASVFQKVVELRSVVDHGDAATPSPLTERMTLFWHNHFVSSQQKVPLAAC